MKTKALCLAVLVLSTTMAPATAATLSAFAGARISFATADGSKPVSAFNREALLLGDMFTGDGETDGGWDEFAGSMPKDDVFLTAISLFGEASALLPGDEAGFTYSVRQDFTVARSADADRMLSITLAPLDGYEWFLGAFGISGGFDDSGFAFAALSLERSDGGPIFEESASVVLFGTPAGETLADQPWVPGSLDFDALIPKLGGLEGEATGVVFSLTLQVDTFALSPLPVAPGTGIGTGSGPDVSVVPVPPAAPLLALGLGCLALLRRSHPA